MGAPVALLNAAFRESKDTVLVVAELGNQGVFIFRLLERTGALDKVKPLVPANTATKTAEV